MVYKSCPEVECKEIVGTFCMDGGSFNFMSHAHDVQVILALVSYIAVALTPTILTGYFMPTVIFRPA